MLVAYSGGADAPSCSPPPSARSARTGSSRRPAYSHSLPEVERDPARAFAESLGVGAPPETHKMERDGYRANGAAAASSAGPSSSVGASGSPASAAYGGRDRPRRGRCASPGFRPGIGAADERGAVAPLRDAGLTKAQVREASRRWGLPTWDKPAAACLSSRVAYGVEVTPHASGRVERAEAVVRRELPSVRNLRVRDLGADRASSRWTPTSCRSTPLWSSGSWRRPRGRVQGGRDRPARFQVGLDERSLVAVTLDAADVLARTAGWVWVPDHARQVRTPRLASGLPGHFAEPTMAFHLDSTSVDDALEAAAALAGHRWLSPDSRRHREATLEPYLAARGELCETLSILARGLDSLPALDVPADVELRRVEDVATLADAGQVAPPCSAGYRAPATS